MARFNVDTDFSGLKFVDRLISGINFMNANPGTVLYVPPGENFIVDKPLPVINAIRWGIVGDAYASTLIPRVDNTELFRTGPNSTQGRIAGLRIAHQNTLQPDNYTFELDEGNNISIEDLFITNCAGIIRAGNTTGDILQRTYINKIVASVDQGHHTDGYLSIHNVASFRAYNVIATSGAVGPRSGSMVKLKPMGTGFMDTIRIHDCDFQSFDGKVATSNRKEHGVHMDTQFGKIVNFRSRNTVYDHSEGKAIKMDFSGHGGTAIEFIRCRTSCWDSGLDILHRSTDTVREVMIKDHHFIMKGLGSFAKINNTSSGFFVDCHFVGNRLSDASPGATNVAIDFTGTGGWTINGNNLKGRNRGNTNYGVGMRIQNKIGLDDMVVMFNDLRNAKSVGIQNLSSATGVIVESNIFPSGYQT